MTTAHLLPHLLPPSSTKLGRLTTSADRPHQHFHDPLLPRPSTLETHTSHHTNYHETRTFTRHSRLTLGLATVLSLRFTATTTGAATLSAPHTTTQDLQNSDRWFAEACSRTDTQRWMQAAARRGDTVYLVVGIRSARNATLTSGHAAGGGVGVLAVVPGVAVAPPGGGAEGKWGGGNELALEAVGEMVFAVLYRKVRLRSGMFSRDAEGMAVLEGGCRWREAWDWKVSVRERDGGRARSPMVAPFRFASRAGRSPGGDTVYNSGNDNFGMERREGPTMPGGPVFYRPQVVTDGPSRFTYGSLDDSDCGMSMGGQPEDVESCSSTSHDLYDREDCGFMACHKPDEDDCEGAVHWEASLEEEEWDLQSDGEESGE